MKPSNTDPNKDMPGEAPLAEEVPGDLTQAATHFKEAARELLAVYGARKPAKSDQVTPLQLADAFEQFLRVSAKLDQKHGETGPIVGDDVTQLGDYALSVLQDLSTWAGQLGQRAARGRLERVTLAVADWIARHEGDIRTLEPVVNALANAANRVRDPQALERLAAFMTRVRDATADAIKQDLEKNNPGRPWRLLNLNRAIVATRSHNTTLMEQVFDELIRTLPEDGPALFAQGMQQMEALNYPLPVRTVMARYYSAWTQHHLH